MGCNLVQLRKRRDIVVGVFRILRQADEGQAVPAEQAAHEAGFQHQRLNPVDGHDHIGLRQQSAAAAEALGRPIQPELPVPQEGA